MLMTRELITASAFNSYSLLSCEFLTSTPYDSLGLRALEVVS